MNLKSNQLLKAEIAEMKAKIADYKSQMIESNDPEMLQLLSVAIMVQNASIRANELAMTINNKKKK